MSKIIHSPTLLKTLSSYVPELITRRLLRAPLVAPTSEGFVGVVLFADISGFTALTERLAEQGPAGAEELTRLLNDYFGQLVDAIIEFGGDVVKFAGDALLALWVADDHHKDLADLTLCAAECALAVQAQLSDYQTPTGQALWLRISLAAGELLAVQLGGVRDRWELLVVGEVLEQINVAEDDAQPGQVMLSDQAWQLIAQKCHAERLPTGTSHLIAIPHSTRRILPAETILSPEAESALRLYIPGAIRERLAAGQSDWLAELRPITVLFVNLPDLTAKMPLEQAQAAMVSLQEVIYHYEGSINKLSVDDKGTTLITAFGLPPLAHEDDPMRGVQVALAIHQTLKGLDLRCAIGVTTGRAFCGVVGSPKRREYTMIGDVVNLAARLMQVALRSQETFILCDESTYLSAQSQIMFQALTPIHVKGKSDLIPIYYPLQLVNSALPYRTKSALIGRTAEIEQFTEHIPALLDRRSSLMIIEGEAGIGKSRLIEAFSDQALDEGVTILIGAADAVEKSTPYYAWRAIFKQLFSLSDLPQPAWHDYIEQVLATTPNLLPLAPLLSPILAIDWPDNELTRQMSGEGRANKTYELLVSLLKQHAEQVSASGTGILLIIEDAHWLDSTSWALLRLVQRDVQPLLLVIATRPISSPVPPEYKKLLATGQLLRLQSLPISEVLTLVCQRLGVRGLPKALAKLIAQKAEGHPFFSEELAYALRDANLIRIEGEACYLVADQETLQLYEFPDSLQAVITSRIDRLTPQQQLTLKVASVIGRVFSLNTLRQVHPIERDKAYLADYLTVLARLDITPLDSPEPEPTYTFKHAMTQEVTYNLMAFAQRRQLHQAIAEWLERTHASDLEPYYPLLAHHWHKTKESLPHPSTGSGTADPYLTSKALTYLAKAGEQALRNAAYREAVGFLTEAVAIADPTTTTTLQLARWHRLLGEAHRGLGQMSESRSHFEQALALLGLEIPNSRSSLIRRLTKELAVHLWLKLRAPKPLSDSQRANLLEAANSYGRLGLILYSTNETPLLMLVALHGFNLARLIGPSPELALSYTGPMTIYRRIGLHSWANTYYEYAYEMALNYPPAQRQVIGPGSLLMIGYCSWQKIEDALKQAMVQAKRVGKKRALGDSLGGLGIVLYYQGQFTAAIETYLELYTLAVKSENIEQQAYGLTGQATILLRMGHLEESLTLLLHSESLCHRLGRTHQVVLRTLTMMALVYWYQGEKEAARKKVSETVAIISSISSFIYNLFDCYAGIAEVYLAMWEEALNSPHVEQAKELKSNTQQACQALRNYASKCSIGQPRAWLYKGIYHWLQGQTWRARRAWRKSLHHAKKQAMPYEEALAHYQIGRLLPIDDQTRQEHLTQAVEMFTRLEAALDLARAKQALDG